MLTYHLNVAGLERDLPICKVSDDLSIGAFVLFGDAELTVRCAEEMLKLVKDLDFDYMLTAEAKGIPLIHEMARQSHAEKYFVARKGMKVYLTDPIDVAVRSITTQAEQHLYISGADAALLKGKRVLLVDDVISTGESISALEQLAHAAGAIVAGRAAILAEGGAAARSDIRFLEPLPVFNPDGTVKG